MDTPPVLPEPPASPALPPLEVQRILDAEHLRLLGIGYYIMGGMVAFFGCFGLLYVAFGLVIASGAMPLNNTKSHPAVAEHADADASGAAPSAPDTRNASKDDGRVVGYILTAMGSAVVLLCWVIGGLTAYAGRCLRQRKHRVFTIVMAGLNCLQIPFGTVLGIFTFTVLDRPNVKAWYGVR